MAQGDPILISLSGATFLLSAETGVIIESMERDISSKLREVFNAAVGYVVGYVFYDFVAAYSWSAIINGTTGFAIAAPGVALTIASDLSSAASAASSPQTYNGVHKSTGGIYTQSLRITHSGEDLRTISGSGIQRTSVV